MVSGKSNSALINVISSSPINEANTVIEIHGDETIEATIEHYENLFASKDKQIVELKGGAKKTTERKFFPGYILVQMNLEDDSWQLVQSTPRVSGFVGGTRDKPLPISEDDVKSIINRIFHCVKISSTINSLTYLSKKRGFLIALNSTSYSMKRKV